MIALKNQSTLNNFSLLYSKATPSFLILLKNIFNLKILFQNQLSKNIIQP